MQYKNILVYLDQGKSNLERVNTAVAMAKAHGARLTGVAVNPLPVASVLGRLAPNQVDILIDNMRAESGDVLQQFSDQVTAEGIEVSTRLIECREGKAPEKMARLARNFDLCILRQANPDKSNADLIADLSEEVLFSSGRPVFFMPYIGAHKIPCRRGLIAWDGSAAAARSVNDTMPILQSMEHVEIIVVDGDKLDHNTDAAPGEDISAHLTAHGVTNRIDRVPSGGAHTSTIILNEVSDKGADILIMGGYGTPKLREMILGGVTRTLLSSMTVPVVMSH